MYNNYFSKIYLLRLKTSYEFCFQVALSLPLHKNTVLWSGHNFPEIPIWIELNIHYTTSNQLHHIHNHPTLRKKKKKETLGRFVYYEKFCYIPVLKQWRRIQLYIGLTKIFQHF